MSTYVLRSPALLAPPKEWVDPFPNYDHDNIGFINVSDEALCLTERVSGTLNVAAEPQTFPVAGASGRVVESFRDLYYNAVYIFPNVINIQNPIPGDEYEFNAWNAKFGTTTTTGRVADGDGEVINTFDSGEVFRPLELKLFNVSITPVAPATISADYTYSFDNAIDALFEFNATRAVLLNTEPEQPIGQVFTYKTDVIKALDGTEQRISYLLAPSETLNMILVYTTDDQFRDLRERLFFRLDTPVLIPKWYEGVLGRNSYSSGTTVLNEDFSMSDFQVNDNVYIADINNETFDLAVIDALTDTQMTLTSQLQNDYTARRFYLYPTKTFLLPKGQPIERFVVEGGRIPLQVSDTSRRVLGGKGAPAFTLFNGRPVLDIRPTISETVADTYDNRYTLFDAGAAVKTFANQQFSDIRQPRTYCVGSRSEWQFWKAFLDEVSGQRKTFYAPTWRNDLVIAEPPLSGSDQIIIENRPDYDLSYFDKSSHKQLQIITGSGTFYRTVTAVTQNLDGNYTLELDQLIPSEPGSTNVLMISFLLQLRLGSDEVEINHYSAYSEITIVQRTTEE